MDLRLVIRHITQREDTKEEEDRCIITFVICGRL